jgi:hypothetical protein
MRLIDLFEKLEWLKEGDSEFVCPCCGEIKNYAGQFRKHTKDCELYTFLVALKAGVFQVVLRT